MAIQHDLPLLTTVAAGLSVAFVFGLAAAKLRLPPIVGYLIAGVLIGPHTPGFIADLEIAEELSEIGVVLLMFGVGLHFSMKDLMEVKTIALPGAVAQIAVATVMGAGLAHLWGWPLQSGIMFGLALSVASTVVLLRAMEEHNLLQSMNGRIAVGWLIVEDLFMVLALVMIPALAGVESMSPVVADSAVGAATASLPGTTGGGPLEQLFLAIGKVGLFVAVMLIAGRRALPWVLKLVARTRSRELFTLAVFAAAVGVAYGAASLFGVSFALGAFFAGMMIRESDMNHEVADRALPFQDAFAVLFFVSVGMLFDPGILFTEPAKVLLVLGIIMFGKSLAALGIVLLFGYPLKTGLLVSASLAQIGEFSFILVSLGLAYGLLPPDGRDLILAGAILSIALNPLMFHGSNLMFRIAARHPKLVRLFDMRDDDLAHLPKEEEAELKDTVILAGHGVVGKHITRHIHETHIDLVVIDTNRERVETLRERGFHAIAGDAGHAETLREAAVDKAVAIIIAVPDSFEARRIAETAKALKPDIKVLVRAHNEDELDYFRSQNADLVLTGPREIGRRIVDYLGAMRRKN